MDTENNVIRGRFEDQGKNVAIADSIPEVGDDITVEFACAPVDSPHVIERANQMKDYIDRVSDVDSIPETYKKEMVDAEALSPQELEVKALFESIKTPTALDITNVLPAVETNTEELSTELEEKVSYMEHDPVTGMMKESDGPVPLSEKSISEVLESASEEPEKYSDTFNSILGAEISDTDVMSIINFIKMVETEKPKKIYSILPEPIKRVILETTKGMGTKEQNETMARAFYDLCLQELKTDKTFLDMDEMLKAEMKELDNPDYMKFYLEHIKEHMEVKIPELADKMEAEGQLEKAKIFRGISTSFTEAYTHTKLQNKIKNKAKVLKKELNKELPNFNKVCQKVNAMYLHSKFVITDTRTLLPTLDRHLPGDIDKDAIARYLILLMQELRRQDPADIKQHTYIYYSIKLINSLEHIHSDDSEFKDIIIGNIVGMINQIESL